MRHAILFVYGLKSIWLPFLWPVFNQIFLMMFLSAWLRRSNVLTGAEWIQTRFGRGTGANLAQVNDAIREKVMQEDPAFRPNLNFRRDTANVLVGILWQLCLTALPIHLDHLFCALCRWHLPDL